MLLPGILLCPAIPEVVVMSGQHPFEPMKPDFVISIILAHDADVSLCVHVFCNLPVFVPPHRSMSYWRIPVFAPLQYVATLTGWPFNPKSSPLNVVFVLQDLGIAVRLTHSGAC